MLKILETTIHEEMREDTPDDKHDVPYERLKDNPMERSQLMPDTSSAEVRFSSFLE